jgi:hypothetical protein
MVQSAPSAKNNYCLPGTRTTLYQLEIRWFADARTILKEKESVRIM